MGGQGQLQRTETEASGQVDLAAQSASGTVDAQAAYGNSTLLEWLGFGGGEKLEKLDNGAMKEAAAQVDRSLARKELESMFDTSGDAPADGRASVTPEQFDEVVEMYSAIRRGDTSLTVDGTDEFRAGTMKDLAKMMQTDSGRDMLAEIANSDHATKIDGAADADHPVTHGSIPGVPLDDDGKEKIHKASTDGKTGVDSTVDYAPGHTVKTAEDGEIPSDVTLYHELVHAWHNGRGDNYPGTYQGIDNDEYQAVWFDEHNENRYRDERAIDLHEDIDRRQTYGGKSQPTVP